MGDYSGLVPPPISAQPISKDRGDKTLGLLDKAKRKITGKGGGHDIEAEKARRGGDTSDSSYEKNVIDSKAKGGMIHKTGPYKLHAGERVLTKGQTRRYNRRRSRYGGKR